MSAVAQYVAAWASSMLVAALFDAFNGPGPLKLTMPNWIALCIVLALPLLFHALWGTAL